jgi:uncharacterized protein
MLLWVFFRSVPLIIAPMIVAMVTVIATMGLLIGMGFTVHIMSSMIPDLPDADRGGGLRAHHVGVRGPLPSRARPGRDHARGRRPPVQADAVHLGHVERRLRLAGPDADSAGAGVRRLCRVRHHARLPADDRVHPGLGVAHEAGTSRNAARPAPREGDSMLAKLLRAVGVGALARAACCWFVFAGVFVFSIVGIMQIEINDNPTRWFKSDHRIRVADQVLNHHFAGTYDAWLVLDRTADDDALPSVAERSTPPECARD